MDSAEKYNLYTTFSGPIGLFTAVICGLAVITSYIYPEQRKFPKVVITWTCVCDAVFGLYVAIKWLPGPVRTNFTDKATLHPALCYFSIYLQWIMLEVSAMLGLLLAFTLYAIVVKEIDVSEMKEKYYKKYLAFVWFPTFLVPLFCLVERNPKLSTGLCKPISPLIIIFRVCNLLVPLVIQLALMAKVFKTVIAINQAVRNDISKVDSRPILWLFIRFFGTQLNEITVWIPVMCTDILNMKNITVSRYLTIFSVIAPGLLTINGIIFMAGNRHLKLSISKWLCKHTNPKAQDISIVVSTERGEKSTSQNSSLNSSLNSSQEPPTSEIIHP